MFNQCASILVTWSSMAALDVQLLFVHDPVTLSMNLQQFTTHTPYLVSSWLLPSLLACHAVSFA